MATPNVKAKLPYKIGGLISQIQERGTRCKVINLSGLIRQVAVVDRGRIIQVVL